MANPNAPSAAATTASATKTVTASIVTTRDGTSEVLNFPGISYALFVSLESAMSAAIAKLASWAVSIAAGAEQDYASGGDCDLSVELSADFGTDSGTSLVRLAWTGLSTQAADDLQAIFKEASRP